MPAPIPTVSGDPIQKLEGFIELITQAAESLVTGQGPLGDLDVKMNGKADQGGQVFVDAQEHLTRTQEELQHAGQDAVEALERLIGRADVIGGQQVPAATEQVVGLDAAVERETSEAAHDLEEDGTALRQDGYDAFQTAAETAERSLEEAREAFEAALQSVLEGLEAATNLVESTANAAGGRIDEYGHQVTEDAQEFTNAAVEATRVWSEELPGLVTEAAAEQVKAVNELYHAWDETEIDGSKEFQQGVDAKIDEANELLESAAKALSEATHEAEQALETQSEASKETATLAQNGAEKVSGLGGGSLLDTVGDALDVIDTIADALANL
jgi:ElaB/YqjD/DUF883 family membrane-anchored ribosome-binding protein